MEEKQKYCQETRVRKKKLTPLKRKFFISGGFLAIVIILLSVWINFGPDNKKETYNLFDIEMISELTTLECRYHNVAVRDNDGGFAGLGREYVWFEYDVILDVGIDINQVKIEEPNEKGAVKVYLPPAQILGARADKSTISKPVCDIGLLGKLTADEERNIINEGTQKLKNDTKTQEVIYEAYNSAKEVLEQYIINMGKLMGKDYTVEWVAVAEDIQTSGENQTESTVE